MVVVVVVVAVGVAVGVAVVVAVGVAVGVKVGVKVGVVVGVVVVVAMKMELRFFVPGIPAPGGSKKVFPIREGGIMTGKFVVTDDAGQKNKDWRASVAWNGSKAMLEKGTIELLNGPVELEFIFHFVRPKSHLRKNGTLSKGRSPYHVSKPDALKLARSTEDALTGIVWRDDAQVVKIDAEKAYSDLPSGCWVVIRAL